MVGWVRGGREWGGRRGNWCRAWVCATDVVSLPRFCPTTEQIWLEGTRVLQPQKPISTLHLVHGWRVVTTHHPPSIRFLLLIQRRAGSVSVRVPSAVPPVSPVRVHSIGMRPFPFFPVCMRGSEFFARARALDRHASLSVLSGLHARVGSSSWFDRVIHPVSQGGALPLVCPGSRHSTAPQPSPTSRS